MSNVIKFPLQRLPARPFSKAPDLEKRHAGGTGSQSRGGAAGPLDGPERRSTIPQTRPASHTTEPGGNGAI
jgi:hypothetical protein